MPVDRTVHSPLELLLNIHSTTTCSEHKHNNAANLLKAAKLILRDEASMAKRHAIELVNKTLKDIMKCDLATFGGKVIVLGGDFQHVLPVTLRKTREELIDAV